MGMGLVGSAARNRRGRDARKRADAEMRGRGNNLIDTAREPCGGPSQHLYKLSGFPTRAALGAGCLGFEVLGRRTVVWLEF